MKENTVKCKCLNLRDINNRSCRCTLLLNQEELKERNFGKRGKNVNKPCVEKKSVQKETGLVSTESPQIRDSGGD